VRICRRRADAEVIVMPIFERAGTSLYYEEFGSGYPLLLFAPGGMRSGIEFWHKSPFDPTKEFAANFRVIAMDQRNAGRSHAPVSAADGWHTYTGDHIALLDHLGIARCHTMGGCIGSTYCLSLIKEAPNRVSAAVLQNPIGLHENREAFREMFDGWAKALQSDNAGLTDAALASFRERMYGGDFVFSVTRDFVRSCATPMIVLAGDDLYHPASISREIAALAPKVALVEHWKTPETVAATVARVRDFLKSHQGAKA
jgi:pimeloyl-ACP methyl ester carboxylesterase